MSKRKFRKVIKQVCKNSIKEKNTFLAPFFSIMKEENGKYRNPVMTASKFNKIVDAFYKPTKNIVEEMNLIASTLRVILFDGIGYFIPFKTQYQNHI